MKDYIKEWVNIVKEAKNSLTKKDFEGYKSLMEELNTVYEDYKLDNDLTYICENFGMANHIFEDALPTLFKTNKKAVKEFIETIKGDNNLLMEFNFFKALENYNENLDAKEYISESVDIASKKINYSTIKESNRKLAKIISKYNIKPSDFISEEKSKLYRDCDYILTNKKKLSNLNECTAHFNSIVEYTKQNYNKPLTEGKKDLSSIVENFNTKYTNLLNEEEKSLVKDIMDFKSPQTVEKKKKLFDRFKNECIETVDKLISESSKEDIASLESIKEQIRSKMFCEETMVTDLAKLLEIRDVLMDN